MCGLGSIWIFKNFKNLVDTVLGQRIDSRQWESSIIYDNIVFLLYSAWHCVDDDGDDEDDLPDDEDHQTDVEERDDKAGPAASFAWRRTAGEEHLEAEGDEVHGVVSEGGLLQVAAVDQHGVLQLLAPAGLVETQLLQLLVGEGDHIVDDLLVLLVVGDGDGGPGDGAVLAAFVAQLEQLHLEELLSAGGAHVVDDGDLDVLGGLPGLEVNDSLSSNEILPIEGRLVDSPVLDLDIPVSSVLSVDGQDRVSTALLGSVESDKTTDSIRTLELKQVVCRGEKDEFLWGHAFFHF